LVLLISALPAHAQLIEDSKSKLKSQKVERKRGFLFFKRKKGKSQKPPSGGRRDAQPRYSPKRPDKPSGYSGPRYSQRSISGRFRDIKRSQPRYSQSKPKRFQGQKKSGPPRYSKPVLFSGKNRGAPRYSQRPSWKGARKSTAPRYSQRPSWKGSKTGGAPRYSKRADWRGRPSRDKVRYSQPVTWSKKNYPGKPRYSQPVDWSGSRQGGEIRYSQPVKWKKSLFAVQPRYSRPVKWSRKNFPGPPRYSKGPSWKGAYIPGPPRYSTFKDRFVVNQRYKRQTRPYNYGMADYQGRLKLKKPNYKNMHPSVHHLTAKGVPNKTLRKALRKWKRFWVRLNPNSENPHRKNKRAKKPKFDRNERHIWNNGRDRKPTTREPAAETPENAEADDQEQE